MEQGGRGVADRCQTEDGQVVAPTSISSKVGLSICGRYRHSRHNCTREEEHCRRRRRRRRRRQGQRAREGRTLQESGRAGSGRQGGASRALAQALCSPPPLLLAAPGSRPPLLWRAAICSTHGSDGIIESESIPQFDEADMQARPERGGGPEGRSSRRLPRARGGGRIAWSSLDLIAMNQWHSEGHFRPETAQ